MAPEVGGSNALLGRSACRYIGFSTIRRCRRESSAPACVGRVLTCSFKRTRAGVRRTTPRGRYPKPAAHGANMSQRDVAPPDLAYLLIPCDAPYPPFRQRLVPPNIHFRGRLGASSVACGLGKSPWRFEANFWMIRNYQRRAPFS